MRESALSGVKVLDVTHHIAGPYCTKLFAELGAEVIKVERPGGGDGARRIGPLFKYGPAHERSSLFFYLNTNKKSVTLDLKQNAGKKIFKRLVEESDILVENFNPRVMSDLGLDYDGFKREDIAQDEVAFQERFTEFLRNHKCEPGYAIDVDLDDLVERAFVAPTAPGWIRDLLESITRRYGLRSPVVQSGLDDDPIF